MWTPDTRAEHDRDVLCYPSDLTEAEWQVLAPLFPPPAETGRHRAWPMRELINAMFFMLRGGIPWRMLPTHFPPHQTVYRWFTRVPHPLYFPRPSEMKPSVFAVERGDIETDALARTVLPDG